MVLFNTSLSPACRLCMPTGDTCAGKSAVHGTGLFAARALPARHALGTFDGARLTSAEFARRKAAGGRCLLRYTDLDGKEVLLDGEGRSDRAFVNSVAGTGCEANVEFVCNGECLEAYTLRAVAEGEELLADYELVRPRGAARRRQMTQAPPPLPPVRTVDAAEFLGRLRHAVLGEGGYVAHAPVRAGASAALASFTASFGRAGCSLAEAAQSLGIKRPAAGEAALEETDGAVPQPLLDALQRAGLAHAVPVLTAFLARGRGTCAAAELGNGLCASAVVALCGTMRVWVASATVQNALLYGDDVDRPRRDYARVREAVLEAGDALLVPAGAVWRMACGGDEVVAVAVDFAAPAAGWNVAAQLAWRLRAERDDATRRAAAAVVAVCFGCDATPEEALKALKESFWGERLAIV